MYPLLILLLLILSDTGVALERQTPCARYGSAKHGLMHHLPSCGSPLLGSIVANMLAGLLIILRFLLKACMSSFFCVLC